ncbi:UPF0172-domain-containing protein [Moniliophthora roreri MCA 2997]|uniref:UPF0172-domain-containing protein n=2 Tax=Moniliophthora roreri TaxID=221103 RepID=V2WXJ1_MONRO|nr:UPF0172-domain-containing protein [Moniliophthora roreri MCA 2997]KAI3610770.1 UPF0172-domain-containing protein [Moniliophthora roreri]
MVSYTIHPTAYFKIFFHAAKHPHRQVNGVLLGVGTGNAVEIQDAVPLLHHWTSLSPMMEIGLDLAGRHAESSGMKLVGYYQACERLDETALAPVGEKVASKIKESFKDAVAFVIDGERLGTDHPALFPYVSQSPSTWRPSNEAYAAFTSESSFKLSSPDLPKRAVELVRDTHAQQIFGDFDDHLEDVTIDWLRNRECLPMDL